jgi:3-carboxy-cis,cis-muconate cycloisomerase
LQVDIDRMRANLELSGGLVMAERALFLLAERLGRRDAQEAVKEAAERSAASGRSLSDELGDDDRVDAADLEAGLEPTDYLGSAGVFVDQALELYREELGAQA